MAAPPASAIEPIFLGAPISPIGKSAYEHPTARRTTGPPATPNRLAAWPGPRAGTMTPNTRDTNSADERPEPEVSTHDRAAETVVERYLDALNAGDVEAVMRLVSPTIRDTSFGCDAMFGRDAIGAAEYRKVIEAAVRIHFQLVPLAKTVDGQTVRLDLETTFDSLQQLDGIDRLRQTNTFDVSDGLIARERVSLDSSDPQTTAFIATRGRTE